jgi:hypothetical protein
LKSNVDFSEVTAKEAPTPTADVPKYDNTIAASGYPTLRFRADAIVASATEKANAMASNAVEQTHIIAVNTAANASELMKDTADRVNTFIHDTTKITNSKVLANPTVRETSEKLREELAADSHELAHKDYGIQGAVQKHEGVLLNGIRDIGWHRPTIEIPDPLIGGLPNGRLFSMIRRFNKVSWRPDSMWLLSNIIRTYLMFALFHWKSPTDLI